MKDDEDDDEGGKEGGSEDEGASKPKPPTKEDIFKAYNTVSVYDRSLCCVASPVVRRYNME